MRTTSSRITAVLTTAGAALAVSAAMFAPVAAADDTIACAPGQIVIDGNCQVPPPAEDNFAPPPSDFFAPAPMDNGGGDNVDIGTGGIDVATGGVDIGGGGVNVGGGGGHR